MKNKIKQKAKQLVNPNGNALKPEEVTVQQPWVRAQVTLQFGQVPAHPASASAGSAKPGRAPLPGVSPWLGFSARLTGTEL